MQGVRCAHVLLAALAVILGGIGTIVGGAKAGDLVAFGTVVSEAKASLPASAEHESSRYASAVSMAGHPCLGGDCGGQMASQSDCLGAAGGCMIGLLPAAPGEVQVIEAKGFRASSRAAAVTGRTPAAEPPPPRA